MKSSPAFLTTDQALKIHARLIKEFGGRPGVRDSGLLESALAMPGASFEGRFLHNDLAAMAAAYLFHLCKSHAFMDGNKRTALAAAEVFILLNGGTLSASDAALEKIVLGIARGEIGKPEVTAFLRRCTRFKSH